LIGARRPDRAALLPTDCRAACVEDSVASVALISFGRQQRRRRSALNAPAITPRSKYSFISVDDLV
jgi:hypothetical protein